MPRANAIVSVETNDTAIIFNVQSVGTIGLALNDISADVMRRAAIHGLTQKVSDAAALGKDATPGDKHAAMQAVVDRLLAGDWNKRGTGETESAPSGLIRRAAREWAFANRKDMTEERFTAWFETKDRAGQLALRKIPEISEIMERMKAERGTTQPVDASNLLNELDGI